MRSAWDKQNGKTGGNLRRWAVNGLKWLLVFTSSLVVTVFILIMLIKSMDWWYSVHHPYGSNKTADGGFDLAGAGSVFVYYFLLVFFIWVICTWVSYKVLKKYF